MKKFSLIPIFLILFTIILGIAVVQQYFSYVGPQLARKASYQADLEALKVDKEKMLLFSQAVEERLRSETTTNFYFYGTWLFLAAIGATTLTLLWVKYDKRKESWARPVDGMFALQTHKAQGVTWRIDPNKTFTSAIGVSDSGEIAELPIVDKVGADRQLDYNKSVQSTRTAIPMSNGNSAKYAAPWKFLAGNYQKNAPIKMIEDKSELPQEGDYPIITVDEAWEMSDSKNWIPGQSNIDGEFCKVNIKESVHLGIIGTLGVGKTSSVGLLAALYAVADGHIVICLDGKGGSDWSVYNDLFEVQETNPSVFPSQWAEIVKEHNKRLTALRANQWKTIDEGNEFKHVFIILEEFGSLLMNIQATDKKLYGKVLTSIVNLMKVSRATGIHICIIDQTLSDCPNEIKNIIKTYIAFKLNGGAGNAVKLYYLDKLADVGEFCFSKSPNNKFQAWYVADKARSFPIDSRDWTILPKFEDEVAMLVDELGEYEYKPKELETGFDENLIINTYLTTKSLNKTSEAVFGKGKKGKYYNDKLKPVLEKAGLYGNKEEMIS